MSLILIRSLIKCLVDTLIAIELSDNSMINEDVAVELLEQISAELQTLSLSDKDTIISEIANLSPEYPREIRAFIQNLPETLGIAEV